MSRLVITVALVVAVAAVLASASEANSVASGGGRVLNLTHWNLTSTAPSSPTYQVQVPCTVVACLLAAGVFPFDPFYGKNILLIHRADYKVPWIFQTTFKLPVTPVEFRGRVILHLDGLSYKGNLTINGILIMTPTSMPPLAGALRRYEIDITPYCRWRAPNIVNVVVVSQLHDTGRWRDNSTDLGIDFYDWTPHPPDLNMGFWRPAWIEVLSPKTPLTISGIVVAPRVSRDEETESVVAFINSSFEVQNWGTSEFTGTFFVTFGHASPPLTLTMPQPITIQPNGARRRVTFAWTHFEDLVVPNPPLWWPWQMGESPLFNITVGVVLGTTYRSLRNQKYGIRQVTSALTSGGARQFFVNGVPMIILGGGWQPDLFLRVDNVRLEKEFRLIRAMGLNAIRLEGKMMHEGFFDLADRFGIVVLPGLGCCDGWQDWGQWPKINNYIAAESVRAQAKRLAGHPSVITFFAASDQLPPPANELVYDRILAAEAWPNPIVSSASQQYSNVSGISGVKMVGPYSWVPPTYWLEDGSGLLGNGSMNYGGAWGFLTEGGPGEAPMTLASWKLTVPAEHLWNATTGSMDSWWSQHMGEPYGHFRNLTYYTPPLNARYGNSTSAAQYLYKAQAANYEGIRAMFEGYTRNKASGGGPSANATGIIQWMMNNAYPSHLWHLYDYYLVSGGGFYGAKKAVEPVHVMMSPYDGTVTIVNNRFEDVLEPISVWVEMREPRTGTARWSAETVVMSLPGDASVLLPSLTVPLDGAGDFALTDVYFVRVSWSVGSHNDNPTAFNWYWMSPEMDVINWTASNGFRSPCSSWANFTVLEHLSPANVSVTPVAAAWDQISVRNVGDVLAFFVYVRLVNSTTMQDIVPVVWSDNFITLLPGEARVLNVDFMNHTYATSEMDLVVETFTNVAS